MEPNALTCQDLELVLGKSRTVLRIPRLSLGSQGIIALVGPNGSGKSSLLAVLAGLVAPTHGSVRLGEHETFDEFERIKQDVQLLSNEAPLYDDLTVGDYLDLLAAKSPRWDREMAERLAAEFPLPRKLPVRQLSTGERTKLRLRLALPALPRVLLVDELTNDLDSESRRSVYRQLDGYSFERNALVVVATNVLGDIERYANRIVLLSQGAVRLDEELDTLKERHRRLLLRGGGAHAKPEQLAHLKIFWNGSEGELLTHRYTPEFPALLEAMGIEASTGPLSLEEITQFYR